ncbi:FHA domain-containing protein [candidate division CSSED10-310 bacterium]|uniref:FHA domain-containing protein n=1 Tax=candidate division CSSED10-310 bacterium TaxID=2855610 RepID=A0ABV6Z0C8_UNCC1
MPKLVLLSGTKVAAKFPITGEKTILGREDKNDIVLEGSSVSRLHSQVLLEGEDFYIEDLGSRNGTLVNGIRITKELLKDGDEIAIGEYTFLFEEDVQTESKDETLVSSLAEVEVEQKPPPVESERFESTDAEFVESESQQPKITERPHEDDVTLVEDVETFTETEKTPAKLVILKNNKMENEHIIDTDIVTIGRDTENILQLEAESISRFHAQIVKEGRKYKLIDLESQSGTYLRGQQINQSTLRNGDEITIGDFALIFRDIKAVPVSRPVDTEVPERTDPDIDDYDDDRTIVESEYKRRESDFIQHPKFVMIKGPDVGQEFTLNKQSMKIGRDTTNDIVIKDESISRLHAIVTINQEEVTVTDQESLNGLEINDELVSEVTLKKGDVFKLGTVSLRFVESGEVYSSRQFVHDDVEQTGVADSRSITSEAEKGKKGQPPLLRIGLIIGIAVLTIFLILSFLFKATPPAPTLSTYSPPAAPDVQQPSPKAVSEISIYQLMTKGKDDLDYHKWENAVTQFDQILAIKPDHEEARLLKGQAREEMKNYETLKLAKRRLEANEDEDALRTFEQIPESSVYFNSAQDQAQLIRKALTKRHFELGKQHQDNKKFAQALQEYEKALLYDEKDKKVLEAKKLSETRMSSASSETTAAPTVSKSQTTSKKRQSAATLIQNGLNDYLNGDCGAALQKFQKVLKLNLPESDPKVDQALNYMRLVSRLKDHFESGQRAFNSGDVDRALEGWNKVLELEKEIPKTRNSTYYNKIALPMAEKLYEKGFALYNAGLDDLQLKEAYVLWQKALTFNPNHGAAQEGLQKITKLAAAVFREGYVRQDSDVNFAISKWKKVLQIVPRDTDYYRKAERMIKKYQK